MSDREKLISLALGEVGYLEKRSPEDMDSKTGNAGSGNWTKYARDLDRVPGFYNGHKNGYPWCDVFVDWCFYKCFGADKAKRLLCQPDYSAGAGCTYSAAYYKAHGQLHATPEPGDQIFFGSSALSNHTGIVYKTDDSYVYTVEGNTSDGCGVISNGGAVCKKRYPRLSGCIYAYGRPNWDDEEDTGDSPQESPAPAPSRPPAKETCRPTYFYKMPIPLLKIGMEDAHIRNVQILLNSEGYQCGEADGEFGRNTENAVKRFQKDCGLLADGEVGLDTWRALMQA